MNITQEQATQIHDLESYTAVTGAKRFKRTAAEMEAGYSPEEALKRRLGEINGTTVVLDPPIGTIVADPPKNRKNGTITIVSQKGVSSDFFNHVPGSPIEVRLDAQWYGWFDTLLNGPYEGNVQKLMQHIMDFGIGVALTRFHFPADIEEFERPVRTPSELL